MADDKKYYYLKLKENFFESDEMIFLESMPDGYMYSNILLKLYLRSLKNNGKLMFNERIPYNSTMLAQITRHSIGVIEKAMSIFKELGLVEILDNGAIYISDIQNFIGRSSTEADRKRDYRNRIENEKLMLGQNSGQMSDKTPPEIEIELEIELEKDIEQNRKFVRHKYGEYKNVLLSDTDLEKLQNEFPSDYLDRIENMSRYMKSTGKRYKDHLATIRNWARREKKESKEVDFMEL